MKEKQTIEEFIEILKTEKQEKLITRVIFLNEQLLSYEDLEVENDRLSNNFEDIQKELTKSINHSTNLEKDLELIIKTLVDNNVDLSIFNNLNNIVVESNENIIKGLINEK